MRVFSCRKLPGNPFTELEKAGIKIIINPHDRDLTEDELIKEAVGCNGLITLLSQRVSQKVIDSMPDLRIISNYAVGYNNIDHKYASEKGIYVTNTPDVLTETTADLGFALLMSTARKIVPAHKFTCEGMFHGWEPELFRGHDIYGHTLGIVGMGRIGTAVARRAKGFSMNVLYHNRKRNEEAEEEIGVKYMDLQGIAQFSDFVILCCPLTDDTFHMIDSDFISSMQESAYLINIARGPVVDEKALITALQENKIAGAGFDVYENEPDVPDELKCMDNVVLLPHIGSASFDTRARMARMCADSVYQALIENRTPDLQV